MHSSPGAEHTTVDGGSEPEERPRRGLGDIIARALLVPLLVVLIALTVIFYVLFTAVRVDGESMHPALENNDRVLLTKSYDVPRRGDVVVVDIGRDGQEDGIIKRLVALPGDVVRVDDDIATVNGVVEDSSRLRLIAGHGEYRSESLVPDGLAFVLGDNRAISLDSRFFGAVPVDRVKAKVVFVFWPPEHFGPVE